MKNLIFAITLLLSTTVFGFANTPDLGDDSLVKIEQTNEFILIEFLRDSDVLTKRQIRIFDEKGKEIFKSKARKYEKITEINMTNVKDGKYMILMVLEDKLVDFQFVKQGR